MSALLTADTAEMADVTDPVVELDTQAEPLAHGLSGAPPDDPDDLRCTSPSVDPGGVVDPIERDHGPLLFINEDKVNLNLPALMVAFVDREDVAYSASRQTFFKFNKSEGIWKPQEEKELAWLTTRFLKDVADTKNAPMLLPKRTPMLARQILDLAKGYAQMGTPPPATAKLFPAANGVLDLSGDAAVLRPYRRDDWFITKSKTAYDPEASCSRFFEVVGRALGNDDDIGLYQRDNGRMLVPGNIAQRVSIKYGEGGTGKSLLTSVFAEILGLERSTHLRTDHLGGRFETHGFQGKDILFAPDVKKSYLAANSASMIKSLTGADRFQTEQKYGGKYSMLGNFYITVTTNSRLPIALNDDASAWRRRMLIHHFVGKPPEQRIANLGEVLVRDEGPGILNWLVQGYYAHRQELREAGDFKLTATQQARIDEWVLESQGHVEFVRNAIVSGKGNLRADDIFERYVEFCAKRGWSPLGRQPFLTKLHEPMASCHGSVYSNHVIHNGVDARGYRGVVFVNPEQAAA